MEHEPHETKGTLTVYGNGEIKVRPDEAYLDLGAVTTDPRVQDAIARNAERMSALIGRIKALGVAEEALQTSGLNVSPVFNDDEKSPDFGKIVQYRVEETLSVRVAPVRAGAVIDEAAAAGANLVGQLAFGLRDEAPLRARAMEAAVRDAMRDAELVARTLSVTLRGPTSVDVSYGGRPIYRAERMTLKAATTPVEAGVLTVSARATVVYAISTRR